TIPPYLYALYSLEHGGNDEIAHLLSGVVAEEMAHLALAANVLNAIAGHPAINDPALLPGYPGPLPGGVDDSLRVPLRPFSLDLVRDTFMVIEHPDHPIDEDEPPPPETTIGAFYTKISQSLGGLG